MNGWALARETPHLRVSVAASVSAAGATFPTTPEMLRLEAGDFTLPDISTLSSRIVSALSD